MPEAHPGSGYIHWVAAHPAHRRLELRQHPALAQGKDEALGLAALEGLSADPAEEVHGQLVAVLRRAARRDEPGALLAQDLDGLVDLRLVDATGAGAGGARRAQGAMREQGEKEVA